MICPRCQKQVATVRVTEVRNFVAKGHPENEIRDHRICETCAQELNLPHTGVPPKSAQGFWQLLLTHQHRAAQQSARTRRCPGCGMTLEELRRKGRVGCEQDYEVFRDYLDEQLERMHGGTRHVGHLPGSDERGPGESRPAPSVDELRSALSQAIREEDFERAAALRDEIDSIESSQKA